MEHDHVDRVLSQWGRERPDLDNAPLAIVGRISRIAIHLDRALQAILNEFSLTHGEFDVLATLRRSGAPYELAPTALFQTLMLSSGAMTNRLDRLERAGLIVRQQNAADRRGTLVSLTEAGIACVDAALTAHLAREAELIAMLDSEEREQLVGLLRTILLAYENDH